MTKSQVTNKNKISVVINPDGVTAREINPFGLSVDEYVALNVKRFMNHKNDADDDSEELFEKWNEAESRLRTFEIVDMDLPFGDGKEYDEFDIQNAINELVPGTLHECELLANGKIKIIT